MTMWGWVVLIISIFMGVVCLIALIKQVKDADVFGFFMVALQLAGYTVTGLYAAGVFA